MRSFADRRREEGHGLFVVGVHQDLQEVPLGPLGHVDDADDISEVLVLGKEALQGIGGAKRGKEVAPFRVAPFRLFGGELPHGANRI